MKNQPKLITEGERVNTRDTYSRNYLFIVLFFLSITQCAKSSSGTTDTSSPGGNTSTTILQYVSDKNNHRVAKVENMTSANWTTFGANGTGTNQFSSPSSLAVASTGKIYITDEGNNRIVRIDSISGSGWVNFGATGAGTNQFNSPAGIFVDSAN